ncbi:MAG: ribosome silencing factor [Clostridiales bacterium]|nr:ribosome silencing factor [Clostridiales bacterium]
MEIQKTLKEIVLAAEDHKAIDLSVISVKDLTVLADYFVICTGSSTTHVKSIADSIEKKLKEDYNIVPHHVEGYASANWILLDYGSVLVHVFLNETRQFYLLERLWSDAPKIDIADITEKTIEEK